MENTLDGGPSVSDSNWWVVSISQQVVNEFPGVWTRSACSLKNEGTRLMCGYLSNLVFSALLAISPGFVLAADTRDGLQEKGSTIETSKYVIEPLRLKTRSIRGCSVFPLTARVRAGTSCSINTLTPLGV